MVDDGWADGATERWSSGVRREAKRDAALASSLPGPERYAATCGGGKGGLCEVRLGERPQRRTEANYRKSLVIKPDQALTPQLLAKSPGHNG